MTEMQTQATVLAPAANPDFRWYVVQAYSGMERAAERNIQERVARAGMEHKFGRILVPTEEVVEIKNGQKKTTERKFFPGYVLVEMVMDDDTWHLVKQTSKVTVLWVVHAIARYQFRRLKSRKLSVRCRKVARSRAIKSNLKWVK